VVFTWVNTIAWLRSSTAALPFTTIMVNFIYLELNLKSIN
jgi:hypothetical protein